MGVLSGRLDVTSWWLWMRASAAEVADSPSISSAGAMGGALERPAAGRGLAAGGRCHQDGPGDEGEHGDRLDGQGLDRKSVV